VTSKDTTPHGDASDERLAPGRLVAAIVFALFALAFFVVGVVLAVTPADQLPGFLGHADSSAHHTLRGVGSLIVGLVFTAAAWFALRYQSLALEEARAADAAQQATAGRAVADTATASKATADKGAADSATSDKNAVDTAIANKSTADGAKADGAKAALIDPQPMDTESTSAK
jgi:hypothetical protein